MTAHEIHSYDAATAPRGMLRHVLPVLSYPGVIRQNTTILANFFRRDLLGRFRGSLLGVFWVLIQPIFLFAIYFTVFGFLFAPRAWSGQMGPRVEFAMYLFSGIIAFSSFMEATTRACNVVLENGNLVKKVRFPCELLPLPSILVSLIVYLVGVCVLIAVGSSMGELRFTWDSAAFPLVLLVHVAMCLGLGLLLATLQVLLRDTTHLYTILSQAWFFLSPVFWPYSMIEDKLGDLAWLTELNPMYPLIQAHRQVLGFGAGTVQDGVLVGGHDQMRHVALRNEAGEFLAYGDPLPGVWHHLGHASLWALGFLIVGYAFFMSRKNKFADLV